MVRCAKAKFVTGLSATLTRKDGHHPIIFMQCGPVRFCADAKAQAAIHPFEHKVLVRPTGFSPRRPAHEDVRIQFHDLYDELMADEARNQLICGDVVQADVQAYRRDRCKDRLLQEHGYFVLRFLAVDVGKCLDEILDTILRVLVTQEKESS